MWRSVILSSEAIHNCVYKLIYLGSSNRSKHLSSIRFSIPDHAYFFQKLLNIIVKLLLFHGPCLSLMFTVPVMINTLFCLSATNVFFFHIYRYIWWEMFFVIYTLTYILNPTCSLYVCFDIFQ